MLSGLAESGQLGEPILLLTKETTVTVLPTLASAVMLFTGLAFLCDLKTRRIPNWLTVISLVLALAFHLTTGGWPGLLAALGGFAVGFGILLVLWLIGGGGGGDVILMGALGACSSAMIRPPFDHSKDDRYCFGPISLAEAGVSAAA